VGCEKPSIKLESTWIIPEDLWAGFNESESMKLFVDDASSKLNSFDVNVQYADK
jgi:hypothetical protein